MRSQQDYANVILRRINTNASYGLNWKIRSIWTQLNSKPYSQEYFNPVPIERWVASFLFNANDVVWSLIAKFNILMWFHYGAKTVKVFMGLLRLTSSPLGWLFEISVAKSKID